MSTKDAIIDPNITIRHEKLMPSKDPGYYELEKRGTEIHDKKSRVIHDYTGTPMIKVDQEGGIFDEQIGLGNYRTLSPQLQSAGKQQALGSTAQGKDVSVYAGANPRRNSFNQNHRQKAMSKTFGQNITEIDSTISAKGLMQRKMYLMKLMLRNEKQANQIMKQKVGTLGKEIHQNHAAVRMLEEKRNKNI